MRRCARHSSPSDAGPTSRAAASSSAPAARPSPSTPCASSATARRAAWERPSPRPRSTAARWWSSWPGRGGGRCPGAPRGAPPGPRPPRAAAPPPRPGRLRGRDRGARPGGREGGPQARRPARGQRRRRGGLRLRRRHESRHDRGPRERARAMAAPLEARGGRPPARPRGGPAGRPRRFEADWSGDPNHASHRGEPGMSATDAPRRLTVSDIARLHADGQRIPMLTAYDYPTARILDEAGIPMLLVRDPPAPRMLGCGSTVRVSMAEMLHHVKAVARGSRHALVIADMPFLSYGVSIEESIANAGVFLREGGAQAVKIEGGVRSARTIEAMTKTGIPAMGPIGLTPQAIHQIGKVRVQGKTRDTARALLADALAVQEAGAFSVVLELVPE